MALAFLNLGTSEVLLLSVIFLIIIFPIGYYGKNTQLGYWGSILLALLSTPVVAFIIISILRYRRASNVTK
jgi:hypothetical protein